MPRGNAEVSKVHYQGNTDDFIVFVDSPEDLKKWKDDKSVPLAQVVSSFKIMITHKHGAQGTMDGASKSVLDNEFGTSNDEECIIKILEKGSLQTNENHARGGDRNDTMGSRIAH